MVEITIEHKGVVKTLNKEEVDVLLNLYHNIDDFVEDLNKLDGSQDTALQDLINKNLVSTTVVDDKNILSLTDDGLNICGSIMFHKIGEKKSLFKEKMQNLPERAVTCLVNRVMWRDETSDRISRITNQVFIPYGVDEKIWYEKMLLMDKRMQGLLEKFYGVLEELDLIKVVNNNRWCSQEVENFLKNEYKNTMDLTWIEEDSLKYYYFFFTYAQNQRNLINFFGEGEKYKNLFFTEEKLLEGYGFSSDKSNPGMISNFLGISEKRIIGFLEEMQSTGIVNERYYPLSSFSFFSDEDRIFVIQDITRYMGFITDKFLTPVVDSLLQS